MEETKKGNVWALIPLIVFVGLFLGVGIGTGDFSTMPLNVAIIVASIVGLVLNRKETFAQKVEIFTKGAGIIFINLGTIQIKKNETIVII